MHKAICPVRRFSAGGRLDGLPQSGAGGDSHYAGLSDDGILLYYGEKYAKRRSAHEQYHCPDNAVFFGQLDDVDFYFAEHGVFVMTGYKVARRAG